MQSQKSRGSKKAFGVLARCWRLWENSRSVLPGKRTGVAHCQLLQRDEIPGKEGQKREVSRIRDIVATLQLGGRHNRVSGCGKCCWGLWHPTVLTEKGNTTGTH